MAEPETPATTAEPDAGGDGKDTKSAPPPANLDEVHERVMATRGEELSRPEPEAGAASEDEEEDKPKGGKPAGTDDEEEPEKPKKAPAKEPPAKPEPEERELKPPEEMDADVTKPGKYKATFTDIDGEQYHVSNIDQLPDDFEPKSQKEQMKALQDLTAKQEEARNDQAEYQAEVAKKGREENISKMTASWDDDVDRLTKDGTLPKDKKERNKAINGTYEVMERELKKGRPIDSWENAFKVYSYEESVKKQAEEAKAVAEDKKRRGAKVMGGGGGTPNNAGSSSTRGRVLQAPPPGVTLDQIHQAKVRSL